MRLDKHWSSKSRRFAQEYQKIVNSCWSKSVNIKWSPNRNMSSLRCHIAIRTHAIAADTVLLAQTFDVISGRKIEITWRQNNFLVRFKMLPYQLKCTDYKHQYRSIAASHCIPSTINSFHVATAAAAIHIHECSTT